MSKTLVSTTTTHDSFADLSLSLLQVLRVQSSEGTKRLDITPQDTNLHIYDKVNSLKNQRARTKENFV